MINILECAILSRSTYHPNATSMYGLSWKLLNKNAFDRKDYPFEDGFYKVTDYKPSSHPSNEFYAQLYVKFVSGKAESAVLAFRGTVARMVGNDIVDVVTWYQDVMGIGKHYLKPFYFPIIIDYYLAAKDYLNAHFHHLNPATSLYLTGHSLGGAMAKMVTLSGHIHPTCVFNAPGCGSVVSICERAAPSIINVNARYGIINKVGTTLGQIIFIDVPEDESQAKALFHAFAKRRFQQTDVLNAVAAHSPSEIQALTDDGIADMEKINILLASLAALRQSQLKPHENLSTTRKTDRDNWYGLQLLLDAAMGHDQDQHLLKQAVVVIEAQHSIGNLIETLLSKAYYQTCALLPVAHYHAIARAA